MTKTRISFSVNKHDAELLQRLALRATRVARQHDIEYDSMTAHMDLTAVHANGCRLRLAELLEADNFNFQHDVFGIRRHLDRETGQLRDCFVPRFAVREE